MKKTPLDVTAQYLSLANVLFYFQLPSSVAILVDVIK